MKASELMFGDWVKLSKGNWSKNRRVGLTDIEMIAESVYLAEPIPLTEKILLKNGFRKGCYVGGYYSPDCPFRVFAKKEGKCGFTTLFDDEIHFSCIFVHQLQHALRLYGIEKEIEL